MHKASEMAERNYLTPSETVYKAYLRSYVSEEDLRNFVRAMKNLFESYNKGAWEDHNKSYINTFLEEAFYHGVNAINTCGNTDSAIYSGTRAKSSVPVVLIEAKNLKNRSEMCSVENINKKALQELVLYYLREEIEQGHYQIKNLIATDGFHWFIFSKKVFYDVFAQDKKFWQQVLEMDHSGVYHRDVIYKGVIKDKIAKEIERLTYTYFDISEFEGKLDDDGILENRKLRGIYKVLSPVHLLHKPFVADPNTINGKFYNELLYILGLYEKKKTGGEMRMIERLPEDQRQEYSMLEQAMLKLEDYGIKEEKERFEIALGLVIEWINRFLFLKLLEAQLQEIDWTDVPKDMKERDENKITLTYDKIQDYCTFYELCMRILAKPYGERANNLNDDLKKVPYLNSSLFELTEAEKTYFSINAICQKPMKVYPQTAVRVNGRRPSEKMDSLEYLLRFLDSYNYGADSIETKEADTIISASVLGLIFEKINGYKDGAFFTPGYITSYMCRDTIRRAIVDKFNEVKEWKCKDFYELKERIEPWKREVRDEANDIINQIRICDPAVGSGHFLVSALNELIFAKAELDILQDNTEKHDRINEYLIYIENDELVLADEYDAHFKYAPASVLSQRVQQTLFEEKRTIIENCLFGVDLNQKSVDICRLRLWIELLKNAYYFNDNGVRHLQTLPNIDINIKQGNSLLSRYPIRMGKHIESDMLTEKAIRSYFDNVEEFKNCSDKARKTEIRKAIDDFKQAFETNGREQSLFGETTRRKKKKDTLLEKYMGDALEWMIEFPEVLTEEGNFQGFDVILGNPPYVNLTNQKDLSQIYQDRVNENNPVYSTYDSQGDLYMLFVERALSLLKPKGRLSFIIPNKWMKVGAGRGLRKLLSKKDLVEMIDFQDKQIFPEATTYTCIISIINQDASDVIRIATLASFEKEELKAKAEVAFRSFLHRDFNENIWVTSSVEANHKIKELQTEFVSLGEYVKGQANYGIKSALTDAFIIQEEKRSKLIDEDESASEILRPMLRAKGMQAFAKANPENYIVFIPKGFTKRGLGLDDESPKPEETIAWSWFCGKYPSVANHLSLYEKEARSRSDKGDYWWELRACAYYEEFSRPKIMYQRFSVQSCFIYDENGYICNDSVWSLSVNDKGLVALLNSDMGWWLTTEFCPMISGGRSLNWDNFKLLPVPRELPQSLSDIADELMAAREKSDDALYEVKYAELNKLVRELYNIEE